MAVAKGEAVYAEGTYAERVGVVVVITDPMKLHRIKVVVPGVYEVSQPNYDRLPWIVPDDSFGGSPYDGQIRIPPLGSEVRVIFPDNNRYNTYYKPIPISTVNHPHEVLTADDTDYPYTRGWVWPTVEWLRFNWVKKWWQWYRITDHLIDIDPEGCVRINLPKDLSIRIAGDVKIRHEGTTRVKYEKAVYYDYRGTLDENYEAQVTRRYAGHVRESYLQGKSTTMGISVETASNLRTSTVERAQIFTEYINCDKSMKHTNSRTDHHVVSSQYDMYGDTPDNAFRIHLAGARNKVHLYGQWGVIGGSSQLDVFGGGKHTGGTVPAIIGARKGCPGGSTKSLMGGINFHGHMYGTLEGQLLGGYAPIPPEPPIKTNFKVDSGELSAFVPCIVDKELTHAMETGNIELATVYIEEHMHKVDEEMAVIIAKVDELHKLALLVKKKGECFNKPIVCKGIPGEYG